MHFQPFLTYLTSEKRYSAHTSEAYRSDLGQFEAFLKRTFEVDEPHQVSRTMIRSWVADLMSEGYKETSVHRKLSAANAWFRFLQREGQLIANPARGIPKPKLPGRLPVFLEEAGAQHLYDLPKGEAENFSDFRDQLILQLFYETGMRLSELIGLRDRDIDRSIRQIRVTGKRNKTRFIPVSPDMIGKLDTYLRLRHAHFTDFKEDAFFVTDKAKKTTRSFVYTRVKRYLSAITTQSKRSPHVLRHTFATHMLNNGAELNVIKELLGHSSLAATQVYTHLSVAKLKGIHGKAHPRSNEV